MHQCDVIRDNLAAYQDGDLDFGERAEISLHLSQCVVCQREAAAQVALRDQLRALKRQSATIAPPAHVWANASVAWKRQDAARSRRYNLRFAVVGACMLLMVFGIVWARLASTDDFPVQQALNNFRTLLVKGDAQPEFATRDADRASAWLRERLGTDLPPVNLSLTKADLLGADVVPNPTLKMGRLLYKTPQGLIAVYVAPRGVRFRNLQPQMVEAHRFVVESSAKDIGLYGWQKGNVGYGVVVPQPISQGNSFALGAQEATDHPIH